MKRYYILFLLLISSVLMVACGDTSQAKSEEDNVSASSEVENIENKYLTEVQNFIDRTATFIDITYDPLFKNHINRVNIDDLKKEANDYLFVAENFNPTPTTDAEVSFHSYVLKFQYEAEKAAHFAVQFIYKRELTDRSIYVDSIENMKIISSQMVELQEKINENNN